jgi:hypothetical protein
VCTQRATHRVKSAQSPHLRDSETDDNTPIVIQSTCVSCSGVYATSSSSFKVPTQNNLACARQRDFGASRLQLQLYNTPRSNTSSTLAGLGAVPRHASAAAPTPSAAPRTLSASSFDSNSTNPCESHVFSKRRVVIRGWCASLCVLSPSRASRHAYQPTGSAVRLTHELNSLDLVSLEELANLRTVGQQG